MLVSVIIPTYNRAGYISKTLQSFYNQNFDKQNFEIIVADNNSTDNTHAEVKQFAATAPDLSVKYFSETRQGVHYARNSAAKHSQGELLYFTDDDMLADPNLLRELVYFFSLDNKLASGTGKVLPVWEAEPPAWILKYCNNALLSLNNPEYDSLISTEDCNIFSCHQMIRRSVFFESGGFNPENTKGIWIGDGETGLNIKIKAMGLKFGYIGTSVTYHIIPASRLTQKYLNSRMQNQGNCDSYSFYRKNSPSAIGLLLQNVKLSIIFLLNMVKTAFHFLSGNDKWHLDVAGLFYCIASVKYNMKLLFSRKWRELVIKDNWIDV